MIIVTCAFVLFRLIVWRILISLLKPGLEIILRFLGKTYFLLSWCWGSLLVFPFYFIFFLTSLFSSIWKAKTSPDLIKDLFVLIWTIVWLYQTFVCLNLNDHAIIFAWYSSPFFKIPANYAVHCKQIVTLNL